MTERQQRAAEKKLQVEMWAEIEQDILFKLGAEIGLIVCDHPFPAIAEMALGETWARDPFDRIIVAHAKSNGAAPLRTKDELIRANYPNARW